MSDKSPFEKIKSSMEARRIFARLPEEGSKFYCKGEGSLFAFKPDRYQPEAGLEGRIILFEETDLKAESVVVNFIIDQERYYTICDFTPRGALGILRPTGTLFRLERRQYYRVALPENIERDCNIINHDGRSVFVSAIILDVSQGGGRMVVPKDKLKDLKKGARLRCALHIGGKWRFELLAEVMHLIPGKSHDTYGAQFLNVPEGLSRKLLSMMLELQREVLKA